MLAKRAIAKLICTTTSVYIYIYINAHLCRFNIKESRTEQLNKDGDHERRNGSVILRLIFGCFLFPWPSNLRGNPSSHTSTKNSAYKSVIMLFPDNTIRQNV